VAATLGVYDLDGSGPGEAAGWLEALGPYLGRLAAVTPRPRQRADSAPWEGTPFLLVGRRDVVRGYLERLTPEDREVLTDCAYFWVVTDAEEEDFEGLEVMPEDRVAVLHWHGRNHNVIRHLLQGLADHPNLAGLSRSMSRVRAEINRIGRGETGAGKATLILGESGTGKEEVARALHAASDRRGESFATVDCGWFSETLLQSQLFGHLAGAFTDARKDKPGLLQVHAEGSILLNDVEAAPLGVQAALLGYTNTPDGKKGKYIRMGDDKESESNAWLLFSTNADIVALLREHRLREDFIFRFEDRVIHVPPLGERPADIPAIARAVWDRLWREGEERRELTPPVLRWLCGQETRWQGNVRALRTLLSLAASLARQPAYNAPSMRDILGAILDRGSDYYHWVGILATPAIAKPPPSAGDDPVRKVIQLDRGDHCLGPTVIPPEWEPTTDSAEWWVPTTGSEKRAMEYLTADGQKGLRKAIGRVPKTKSSSKVRESVRLSRILCYVALTGKVDRHDAKALGEVGTTVTNGDLKALADAGVLAQLPTGEPNQAPSYGKADDKFNQRKEAPSGAATENPPPAAG
jgi:hypothetical protein